MGTRPTLLEDLGRAVATGQVDLVRSRPVSLLVEVDEEVGVERVAAVALAIERKPGRRAVQGLMKVSGSGPVRRP